MTTATPVNAKLTPVYSEVWRAGQYDRRFIGKAAKIILSDGSAVVCEHAHRSRETGIRCAQAIVNRLNAAHDNPRED